MHEALQLRLNLVRKNLCAYPDVIKRCSSYSGVGGTEQEALCRGTAGAGAPCELAAEGGSLSPQPQASGTSTGMGTG